VTRVAVLGGGGVAGIAWASGLVAGLARQGMHVAQADGFVGTSAGSVVCTQLACRVSPETLLTSHLAPADASLERARPYSQADADARNRTLMDKVGGDVTAARQRIGAFTLRSNTVPPAERRAIVAARLPQAHWPARVLRVVAVDTASGEHRVFDRHSGVELVDAVAASCAVPGAWPAVAIQGRLYMDGGIRSLTNADIALGASRVLVIAPLGWGEGNPVSGHLRAETARLREAGARVNVIVPDPASAEALGDNVLDPARCAPSARAGLAQGLRAAASVAADWAV
jgi:NTE family protein